MKRFFPFLKLFLGSYEVEMNCFVSGVDRSQPVRKWLLLPGTYLSTLANSTLIILFSEMFKILRNYFFQIKKNIVKENSGYLRIFHLLK
jgi:hypothetical protein